PGSQGVTPEDVGRTARPTQPSVGAHSKSSTAPVTKNVGPYALGKIDFSDPATHTQAPGSITSSLQSASDDLRKPSLVFVRSVQSNPQASAREWLPARWRKIQSRWICQQERD